MKNMYCVAVYILFGAFLAIALSLLGVWALHYLAPPLNIRVESVSVEDTILNRKENSYSVEFWVYISGDDVPTRDARIQKVKEVATRWKDEHLDIFVTRTDEYILGENYYMVYHYVARKPKDR